MGALAASVGAPEKAGRQAADQELLPRPQPGKLSLDLSLKIKTRPE